MNLKSFGLVLMGVTLLMGCGEPDLNKDFKPVGKDAPMPSATGASSPNQAATPSQATPAATPP